MRVKVAASELIRASAVRVKSPAIELFPARLLIAPSFPIPVPATLIASTSMAIPPSSAKAAPDVISVPAPVDPKALELVASNTPAVMYVMPV